MSFAHSASTADHKYEAGLLVAGIFADVKLPKSVASHKAAAVHEGFAAKLGQTFHAPGVVLIGLGDEKLATPDTCRKLGGWAFKSANDKRAKSVAVLLPHSKHLAAACEGFELAAYRFDKYITENKSEIYVHDINWIVDEKVDAKSSFEHARVLSESVCLARDLINEGPTEMNPVAMAARAQKDGKALGLTVTVLDEKAIAKENMRLILAVARASSEAAPPRFIQIQYKPLKKTKKHVALVGKGVTFDSGGLDIKNAEGMIDMKVDMSGAACVMATMFAIAKLKLDVAVTGYLACVENGISAHAYHPGDVIVSRKGLSIEINNTDAEGRLILADALDYAQSQGKCDYVVDIATLTGASMIALGTQTAALFSNDDKLSDAIQDSGKKAGEDFWRLPLNDNLQELLKSPIADMKNSGGRYGGAITGALFLKKFVREGVTWAHLDIAGPATSDKDHAYLSKGGVGFGVRTLVKWIEQLA